MPLVLETRAGSSIHIGNEVIFIHEVHEQSFDITDGHGNLHTITEEEAKEVFPEVFISSGTRGPQDRNLAKVVIDAPREIKVLRDTLKDA